MRVGLPERPVKGVVCLKAVLASRRRACGSALGLTGGPGASSDANGRGRPESWEAGGRWGSAT